ncbi:protein FAM200C-like [Haematobia irritans]|uniref:protein FAM200C-like n=1 Tax=Haematobia irritans TaxID=7368 RepID=UPI003F506A74
MNINSTSVFNLEAEKALEASFEISWIIARNKKPHTIGELVIKPSIIAAASKMLDNNAVRQLSKIPLSNNTHICEELLFSKPLTTTSKGEDIFTALSDLLDANDIPWGKIAGICTDGAPSMTGCKSGFIHYAKQKNNNIIFTHCVIHRQALAARTLPDELRSSLNCAIEVVNFIKCSALQTRLFETLYSEDIENRNLDGILLHLDALLGEFNRYFPDMTTDYWQNKLFRNPFLLDVMVLPEDIQEEAIDLKNDSIAKDDFDILTTENFWLKYRNFDDVLPYSYSSPKRPTLRYASCFMDSSLVSLSNSIISLLVDVMALP